MAEVALATREATPGLRERKAAATRLAIVRALRVRLATMPLADISADDLADDADVSRMTFFNYFPTKDHAVDLLMIVWLFELGRSVEQRSLRGVAAIEYLFGRMGDEVADAPALWPRVLGHFALRSRERPLPVLGLADATALGGDASSLQRPATLGGMLMEYIDEARRDGDLDVNGSSYELAHYLGGLATGAAVIGHSSPDTDWRRLFRRHARRALGLLDRDASAKPPTIPARYRKTKGEKKR